MDLDPFAFSNEFQYIGYDEEFGQFKDNAYGFSFIEDTGQVIDDPQKYPFLEKVRVWTPRDDGDAFGYVGFDGSIVIPPVYYLVDSQGFRGEYAAVSFDENSHGIIDRENNVVKRSYSYSFTWLKDSLFTAVHKKTGHIKVVDVSNDQALFQSDLYKSLSYTGEGYCAQLSEGDWILLDQDFQVLSSRHFAEPLTYHEGLAVSQSFDGIHAYVDKMGRPVITLGKDPLTLLRFSEGKALVYGPYKVTCYDREGNVIFEKRCDKGAYTAFSKALQPVFFTDGLAPILVDGASTYGIVDQFGNYVIEPILKQAEITNTHRAIIKYKDYVGIAKTDSGLLKVSGGDEDADEGD